MKPKEERSIAQQGQEVGRSLDFLSEQEVTTICERSTIEKRDYWWTSGLLD